MSPSISYSPSNFISTFPTFSQPFDSDILSIRIQWGFKNVREVVPKILSYWEFHKLTLASL